MSALECDEELAVSEVVVKESLRKVGFEDVERCCVLGIAAIADKKSLRKVVFKYVGKCFVLGIAATANKDLYSFKYIEEAT